MSRSPKPAGERRSSSKGKRKPARKQPPTVQRATPAPKIEGQPVSRQRPLISAEQARLIEGADRRRHQIEALMRHSA